MSRERVSVVYWVGAALVLIFALAMYWMNGAGLTSLRESVETQREQLQALQAEVSSKKSARATTEWGVAALVTGVDAERVSTDSQAIRDFAELVMTWSNQKEYDTARMTVMSEYGLTEDDQFVKVFLPWYSTVTDASGKTYSMVDMRKANCHYVSSDVVLSGIRGDVYSYFVTVTAMGSRDGASARFNVVMQCDIDASGTFSNMNGYVLSQ